MSRNFQQYSREQQKAAFAVMMARGRQGQSAKKQTRSAGPSLKRSESSEIVKATRSAGGFTYDPWGKRSPKSGFVVSPYKKAEAKVPYKNLTADTLKKYVKKHSDLLSKPNHFLGTWVNDGHIYIDVVVVTPNREEALKIGKEAQQEAVFDLGTLKAISVSPPRFTPQSPRRSHAQATRGR